MTATTQKQTPGGNRASAKETKKPRQFSPKSTNCEAQRMRIVEALRRGPKTSYDLRRMGCYQAPARIKELRDRFGYVIQTERVTLVDRDGFLHPRSARYRLVSEPATD